MEIFQKIEFYESGIYHIICVSREVVVDNDPTEKLFSELDLKYKGL